MILASQAISADGQVTLLLNRWHDGDQDAFYSLWELLMAELKRLSKKIMREFVSPNGGGEALQTTELIHQAFPRFVKFRPQREWQHRGEFFALARKMLLCTLLDYRRYVSRHAITESSIPQTFVPCEWGLAIDEALEKLTKVDPDQAKIIHLRFFQDVTVPEILEVMHWSRSKFYLEFRGALGFLRHILDQTS